MEHANVSYRAVVAAFRTKVCDCGRFRVRPGRIIPIWFQSRQPDRLMNIVEHKPIETLLQQPRNSILVLAHNLQRATKQNKTAGESLQIEYVQPATDDPPRLHPAHAR